MNTPLKPRLSLLQIVNMNVGFFGIQYSFGLQQSNMSPIYNYLGADEATLPLLWLAGPMTGLLVQPFVGSLSDRTTSRLGRRTPYFLIGAILCSLCLLAMPYSSALWMAASLLWILDAANNITMEPYRAFVSDKLREEQQSIGFLVQSAMTGLGQTLSYLTPTMLVWFGLNKDAVGSNHIPQITVSAFLIGAVFSITSIAWTLKTTREHPLSEDELAAIRAKGRSVGALLQEIVDAFRDMPPTMRQLGMVMLLQWYGMFCYWQYITLSLSTTLFGTTDPTSQAFRDAALLNGQIGSFYNLVAFLGALAMIPVTRRLGPQLTHAVSLTAAGIGMLLIPEIHNPQWLYLPMIGVGLAWASIMGNPYIILAKSIPAERTGVYMGIFNMFIVVPMLIQIFTLPLYYGPLLNSNPENVIRLAGVLLMGGAVAMLRVRLKNH
ncbi:MAG: MFS transporter [Limnobacter sp.]|uniref:MFS transporter n=1 Tax=Limnobacter sp. TaxID=2003368 RepID=UPI003919BC3C